MMNLSDDQRASADIMDIARTMPGRCVEIDRYSVYACRPIDRRLVR